VLSSSPKGISVVAGLNLINSYYKTQSFSEDLVENLIQGML